MQTFRPFLIAALATVTAFRVSAAEGWETDWGKARATASEKGKDLLVHFTGSDWCVECATLREAVFAKPEFAAAAKDFVLVEIDFPKDTTRLSAATRAQNEKLHERFAIRGFPTVALCDATGRPYAQTGPDVPASFFDHLKEQRQARVVRDGAFAEADKATGVERATLLAKALTVVPAESLRPFYGDTLAEIAKLDPDNVTGLNQDARIRASFGELEQTLRTTRGTDERLALIDKFIAEQKPEGATKQRVLFTKSGAYFAGGKLPEAITVLDEIAAIDPASDIGKRAVELKQRLQAPEKESK
ncbi:MAG: hypothetical protein QOE70_3562 [Chthoniobacter sp.]|jgi:thioredoxin-related protein|nr:hypothetical protein [Chthoniobacter sp.]